MTESTEAPATEGTSGRRQRGGRRLGAGRPPSYQEPLLRTTVTLPASYVAQLRWFGRGNLSDGIRLLAEHACDQSGRFWLDARWRNPEDGPDGRAARKDSGDEPH